MQANFDIEALVDRFVQIVHETDLSVARCLYREGRTGCRDSHHDFRVLRQPGLFLRR